MCGIVGFISGERRLTALQSMFTQALVADAFRGWDSTGVALVSPANNLDVFKRAFDATTFIGTDAYTNNIWENLPDMRVAIGHNRSATRGSIKHSNAHPFTHGDYTVVHNGHISNANMLVPGTGTVEVDSMAIPIAFTNRGEHDGLEALRGGFSLAWWNAQDRTFNLARNKERPMTFALLRDHNVLVFGSEHLMLNWILARNNLAIKDNKFFELPPGIHMKWDPNNPRAEPVQVPFSLAISPVAGGTSGTRPAMGGTTNTGASTGQTSNVQRGGPSLQGDMFQVRLKEYEDILGEVPLKLQQQQNWATSRKQINKAASRLSRSALFLGQVVLAAFKTFEKYGPKQDRGQLLGNRTLDNLPCMVPNVSAAQADELIAETHVWSRIINCKEDKKTGRLTLVVVKTDKPEYHSTGYGSSPGDVLRSRYATSVFPGPGGTSLNFDAWRKATADGCAFCSGLLVPAEAREIRWLNGQPVCGDHIITEKLLESLGYSDTKAALASMTGRKH